MARLLTPEEMAEDLGVEPETLLLWARQGKIPAIPAAGDLLKFRSGEVLAALNGVSDKAKQEKRGLLAAKRKKRAATGFCPHPTDAFVLRQYRKKNMAFALNNQNETWMWNKLKATGLLWGRQGLWAYRMFDFWCEDLGVAVEVDGPSHDRAKDARRDAFAFVVAGIIVLRVRNWNEEDAAVALAIIAKSGPWRRRQQAILQRQGGLNKRNQFKVCPCYEEAPRG